MPARGTLAHPHLLASLSALYQRTATIQTRSTAQDAVGGQSSTWTTVPGLEAIACTHASRRPTSELRDLELTVEENVETIDLQGYFPSITAAMRAMLDDGTIWDIRGTNSDSQRIHTMLLVRRMLPTAVAGS